MFKIPKIFTDLAAKFGVPPLRLGNKSANTPEQLSRMLLAAQINPKGFRTVGPNSPQTFMESLDGDGTPFFRPKEKSERKEMKAKARAYFLEEFKANKGQPLPLEHWNGSGDPAFQVHSR